MKKQICSLALSTLFGVGVALAAPQQGNQAAPPAQDQAAPPQQNMQGHRQLDPNRQLHMLTKRLQLTGDQQNQILPILTNRAQQMENLRSDNSLSPKDRHARMRSIREDGDAQIRAVLNDQQKQAYDGMQQQMRQRQQERREQRQNSAGGSGTL
jgi:hypothetical protein